MKIKKTTTAPATATPGKDGMKPKAPTSAKPSAKAKARARKRQLKKEQKAQSQGTGPATSPAPAPAPAPALKKALKLRSLPLVKAGTAASNRAAAQKKRKDLRMKLKEKLKEKMQKLMDVKKEQKQGGRPLTQEEKREKRKRLRNVRRENKIRKAAAVAGGPGKKVAHKAEVVGDGDVAEIKQKSADNPVDKLLAAGKKMSEEKIYKNIVKALTAVLAVSKDTETQGNQKDLLSDPEDEKIFASFAVFKHARVHKTYRMKLPHPWLLDRPEGKPARVCLFVKDPERKMDPEESVQHYQDMLASKGVDCVTRVIPMRELIAEFNLKPLQTSLARQYDVFLADRSMLDVFSSRLGKAFSKTGYKKLVGVDMDAEDLKAEIHKSLSVSFLRWKGTSDQARLLVGMASQGEPHLVANVSAAISAIKNEVPGGWANIRSIYLQADSHTLAVPVYMSLSSGNAVTLDNVENMKERKENKRVVGPLSTAPGKTIGIDAVGRLQVRKDKEVAKLDRDRANRIKLKLTQPQTMIPAVVSAVENGLDKQKAEEGEQNGVEEEDLGDDEEMQEPGKLVRLEHAYLRSKLAQEEEPKEGEKVAGGKAEEKSSPAADKEKKDNLDTSSSLQGVKKRRNRKRKVDMGTAPAPSAPSTPQNSAPAPKTPTPDYSLSADDDDSSSPPSGKKPKQSPKESVNTPKLIVENTPGASRKQRQKNNKLRRSQDAANWSMIAEPPTPIPDRSGATVEASTPKPPAMKASVFVTPGGTGQKMTPGQNSSNKKKKNRQSTTPGRVTSTGGKKKPTSILKRNSVAPTPTSPTRSATKLAMADPSPKDGEKGGKRRVRFSLPNEKGNKKKGRRKTMF